MFSPWEQGGSCRRRLVNRSTVDLSHLAAQRFIRGQGNPPLLPAGTRGSPRKVDREEKEGGQGAGSGTLTRNQELLHPPNKSQPRPNLADRTNLVVHQSGRQDQIPQDILGDVGRYLTRPLRPSDPQPTPRRERQNRSLKPIRQFLPPIDKQDDHIHPRRRAKDPRRQRLNQSTKLRRLVHNPKRGTDLEFQLLRERSSRVARHGSKYVRRIEGKAIC